MGGRFLLSAVVLATTLALAGWRRRERNKS